MNIELIAPPSLKEKQVVRVVSHNFYSLYSIGWNDLHNIYWVKKKNRLKFVNYSRRK